MIFARPHRPHNGREKVRTKSGGEGYKKLESQGPQPPKSGGFRVLWGIRLMVGSRVLISEKTVQFRHAIPSDVASSSSGRKTDFHSVNAGPIPAGATKFYERIRTHSRSGRCALL